MPLFDISKLPDSVVSRDLFSDSVRIERKAFLEAQAEALMNEQQELREEGYAQVVLAPQAEVQDQLWSMDLPSIEYDQTTTEKLSEIEQTRTGLEQQLEDMEDDGDSDALYQKLHELDTKEQVITQGATVRHAEAVKAVSTAFLILDPDGRVRREFRVPRMRTQSGGVGNSTSGGPDKVIEPPTSDDLKESQLSVAFTQQALTVRLALLSSPLSIKQLLVVALHDKVTKEALAIRSDANGTSLHATRAEGFSSPAREVLQRKRVELDPFLSDFSVSDDEAYQRLENLTEKQLDELIALLTVETLTANLQRRTPLIHRLADELSVNVREQWRPDTTWLAGYQKAQLAHLIGELRGVSYVPAMETKKKSELVEHLVRLFTDAAEGRLEDPALADRVNQWLPANLRADQVDAVQNQPGD